MATSKPIRNLVRGVGLVALCTALFATIGCGSGGKGDVKGKVTVKVKGKEHPVVHGTVTFMGSDGVARVGTIQPDGTYTVKDIAVGEAKVMVDSPKPTVATGGSTKDGRKTGRQDPKDLPSDAPKVERPTDTAPTVDPEVAAKWQPINAKYADQSKTTLKFSVRSGDNTYDIEVDQ